MPDIDQLVPDPVVAEEFHVSLMTLWRWDRDPRQTALGWPPKVKINQRNYRHRSLLEGYKSNLLRRAQAERESLPRFGGEAAE